jgi:signal transduction histidine kinase
MSLRFRLAIFSSLITLLALVGLSVIIGFILQRRLVGDLDEELGVQAKQILDEASLDSKFQISSELGNTLTTASGSSTAFLYTQSVLQDGAGALDAPNEPLDPAFFKNPFQTSRHCNCYDWRVVSLRFNDLVVQVGRPLSIITKSIETYASVALLGSILISLLAGLVTSLVVNRTLNPLEHLAKRVRDLESGATIPGIGLRDEIGVLARALDQSLQALRVSRARQNRFVLDAAHELRTPVTALLTDLEANRARQRSVAENSAVLERSWQSAQHLRRLINNLLTLSQTERELHLQEFDLLELASTVTDRLMPIAAAKDLELSVEGQPAVIRADRLMLERVLENIVGNALKFTDSGEVRVTLKTRADVVELSVTDTGMGMNDAELELAFEAFHRGNSRAEGSGLGLAVVKAVMDAHGGTVEIGSQPGVGTSLVLEFPKP